MKNQGLCRAIFYVSAVKNNAFLATKGGKRMECLPDMGKGKAEVEIEGVVVGFFNSPFVGGAGFKKYGHVIMERIGFSINHHGALGGKNEEQTGIPALKWFV